MGMLNTIAWAQGRVEGVKLLTERRKASWCSSPSPLFLPLSTAVLCTALNEHFNQQERIR